MPARERRRLTDAAIARLRAREMEYTVWDDRAPGLGVRVRPTGGKSYVLLHRSGGRSRRVSLGPVSLRTVAEARRDCLARQAAHEPDRESAPRRTVPRFREFVEGEWKDTHFARYKPSTKTALRSLLASQLMPAFARSRSTAYPPHGSGAGSMRSAGLRRPTPTAGSKRCARS